MTRLRRSTVLWVVAMVVGVAALAAIAIATTPPDESMDPEGTGPVGGAALLAVLERNGVEVEVARSAEEVRRSLGDGAAGDDTSVVVANPTNLGTSAATQLREQTLGVDRLVLLSPDTEQLLAMRAAAVSVTSPTGLEVTSECDNDPIDDGDRLAAVDARYETPDGSAATTCFPLRLVDEDEEAGDAHGSAMVQLPSTGSHPPLTIVGTRTGFGNRVITQADNAAIALRLLGGSPRLIWYQPGVGDLSGGETRSAGTLWPLWLGPVLGLVAVGTVLLAVIRGRRLGRLVAEPLPVVVHAAETTESRGRLYRRAQDRPRAAAVLRLATIDRLRSRLALRRTDPLDVVARATSAATSRPVSEVMDLVAGPDPTDDAALVQLAQDLSDLEEEAHRP